MASVRTPLAVDSIAYSFAPTGLYSPDSTLALPFADADPEFQSALLPVQAGRVRGADAYSKLLYALPGLWEGSYMVRYNSQSFLILPPTPHDFEGFHLIADLLSFRCLL